MSIEAEQAQAIAERLVKIHNRVMELRSEKPAAPLRAIHVSEFLGQPIRSRLSSVDDAESGLEYAAWLIGETLAHTGGDASMRAVFELFEAMIGTRASSWLDHRWNGVTAPGASWVS